jgi:hypothetical protein
MPSAPPVPEDRGKAIIGILGVLAGVLVAASLVAGFLGPSPTPLNTYSTYLSNVNLYWTGFFLTAAAGVLGIPFFAGVGRLLVSRSPSVAPAATLAMVTGILIAVLGSCLSTGAYWAITQVPVGSTYQSNAAFEAAFWNNLSGIFSTFGFALVGVGFILFGWLGWKSEIVPNWLAIVAFIAGVAGLVAGGGLSNSAIGILGFFGFIIPLISFTLWGIVIGARLLMAPKGMSMSPPSAG